MAGKAVFYINFSSNDCFQKITGKIEINGELKEILGACLLNSKTCLNRSSRRTY
ncbi:hypothetical protein B4U80_02230 [Leptotrombidium deliense]|uniref:Uncharacterized protein n=1 Tax=Leptotrombidium deliense TaxID=299467 RepID=A0A443RVQ0_9ACAR|nr:hypothetical protein B4U80_02230 [Leptotrombidium deliense]